jgi:CheY-like chemotaxis protein
MKVLCIDDDNDDRELFADIIDDINKSASVKSKIEVVTASECDEALELLLKMDSLPGFIFMDINMPKQDGYQCVPVLKSHERLRDIPIIVCTTGSMDGQLTKMKKLGVQGVIVKQPSFSKMKTALLNFFTKQEVLS